MRRIIPICLAISLLGCQKDPETRPNIIYFYTDQQSESMMSCSGNEYLETPAMDYIANNGIRFTRAYATNPVCSPSRVSMMTGRFPGYFSDRQGNQVRDNKSSMDIPGVDEGVLSTSLTWYLKEAGYELVFGGKEHLPPPLIPAANGYKDITDDERDILAREAASYVKEKHDKPYFMIVSLINPHDICYMVIRDFDTIPQARAFLEHGKDEIRTLEKALQLPEGISQEQFFAEYCPPLPQNSKPQEDEPLAIDFLLDKYPFSRGAREAYTDEQWRMHRWAYARLTEIVDAQIGVVLDALIESGQEENTLVILSSDHGDNDASHSLEHKCVLYEEAANVPFAAMWKGHIPAGQVNITSLVSNGLDLLPTICDYAGIDGQADPRGRSLRPLFEGNDIEWRPTLGIESEIGRMVVSEDGYKYTRYDVAGQEERLMDLNTDPRELTHFTEDESYSGILTRLRKSFDEDWFPGY